MSGQMNVRSNFEYIGAYAKQSQLTPRYLTCLPVDAKVQTIRDERHTRSVLHRIPGHLRFTPFSDGARVYGSPIYLRYVDTPYPILDCRQHCVSSTISTPLP